MTFDQLENIIFSSQNIFDKFIDNVKRTNKKVFLFGAGLCGRSYLKVFKRKNIPLEGIIDNYKTSLDGYPVSRLETVVSNYDIKECVLIISAPGSEDQIRKQVLCIFPKEQIFTFAISRYGIGEENESNATKKFFSENRAFLSEFYDQLGDSFSKEVFCHIFIGRVTAEKEIFESVRTEDFYYPPEIIKLDCDEILVELGSNNGDTLREFISRCPAFQKAYCFEPDSACLDVLHDISNRYANRIKIIPKIAWDKKCNLSFCNNSGDMSSFVDEEQDVNDETLPASSIDIEIEDSVTFIKMDIEGAELQALRGAENHIRRFKPKLAISVYHKRNDLVEIPKYILSIRSDYKFYLRHHGNDDTDTVLYAI